MAALLFLDRITFSWKSFTRKWSCQSKTEILMWHKYRFWNRASLSDSSKTTFLVSNFMHCFFIDNLNFHKI